MHQSVYDKALAIFHEGTKNLELITKAIDRERIESCIQHKLEERTVKQDLLTMIKDKNRLDNEPKEVIRRDTQLLRRENTFSGVEAFKKRKQLTLKKSLSSLPQLTCTTANIPKIMGRQLSKESEFHNWLTGLPRLAKPSLPLSSRPVTKETARPLPEGTKMQNTEVEEEHRRCSKVSNIVYNVPLFSKEERKLIRENSLTSFDRKNHSTLKIGTRLPSIKSRKESGNKNGGTQETHKKRPKTQYNTQKPKFYTL